MANETSANTLAAMANNHLRDAVKDMDTAAEVLSRRPDDPELKPRLLTLKGLRQQVQELIDGRIFGRTG